MASDGKSSFVQGDIFTESSYLRNPHRGNAGWLFRADCVPCAKPRLTKKGH